MQAHKSTFEFFEMALGFDEPGADAFPPLPICRQNEPAPTGLATYGLRTAVPSCWSRPSAVHQCT